MWGISGVIWQVAHNPCLALGWQQVIPPSMVCVADKQEWFYGKKYKKYSFPELQEL